MPRSSFPLKLTAVLVALAAAALLWRGTSSPPASGQAASPAHAAVTTAAFVEPQPGQHGRPAQSPAAGADATTAPVGGSGTGATDAASADLTAATTTSGGLCSVPGIGDIGGLLGFCAMGSSGLIGDLNNVCQPSLPEPEPASSGIDAMVAPPASGKQTGTLYDEYGVAGNNWAAINLQCSDMTSLIGNNVAGMVFDAAKSIDRVTITVYEAAAGNGIVSWLQRVTDDLITSLGRAIYFPYLSIVVILAAIWLAWQGLIRKRATRTIEGTVWMIAACAAAIFLIGMPGEVTGLGSGVSDGISQALDAAFAKLPSPGPSSCVPIGKSDPQVQTAVYSYTSGSTVVDQNADELWSALVCKPWLVGEFGTSVYTTGGAKPTVVNTYGRSLLWAQAIAADEHATPALIQAKQAAYSGIASSLQASDPAIYPLFQGKDWTTRLEVAFAALFAALVAGVLILLISVTLILLKLSFLLLLIVGPFFLLIGAHPGFGRVVALRWVELVVGVLLKQAAVALVLSLLLYCYALIMGTSDAVLPWALKILMIALVTVAAFIYRKPFQHLFSAVGYGVVGSQERAEGDLARAAAAARVTTVTAATTAVPGIAAYRAMRWARRNPGQAASVAMAAASGGATGAVAAGLQASGGAEGSDPVDGSAAAADGTGVRAAVTPRVRAGAASSPSASPAPEPPPLKLPSRTGGPAPASPGSGRSTAAGGAVSRAMTGAWPGGRSASGGAAVTGRQPAVAPPRQPRSQGPPGQRVRTDPRPPPSGSARQPRELDRPRPRQTARGQSGTSRSDSDRRAPATSQPRSWQGQPMSGPLARRAEEPERLVPFWLRPVRRK
jgi:TrbL/VirB6 plasmid conjugal transfer protein